MLPTWDDVQKWLEEDGYSVNNLPKAHIAILMLQTDLLVTISDNTRYILEEFKKMNNKLIQIEKNTRKEKPK